MRAGVEEGAHKRHASERVLTAWVGARRQRGSASGGERKDSQGRIRLPFISSLRSNDGHPSRCGGKNERPMSALSHTVNLCWFESFDNFNSRPTASARDSRCG